MEAFQLTHLYPFVDIALVDKDQKDIDPLLQEKAFGWNASPKEIVPHLREAEVIYLHPDGFDKWTDILFVLAEKIKMPVRLFIIAGSDYALGDEHMEPFLAFFPRAEFWIMNWCGSFPRCKLLPIGVNEQVEERLLKIKSKPVGISFLLNYIGNEKREEFFAFLKNYPEMQMYCLERGNYQEYCSFLSACFFSTCPMGEGFDTYRFWESLMVGTIPIVKNHPFYHTLLEQYPSLPVIRIETWDDLPGLVPSLTQEKWKSLLDVSNIDICFKNYWTLRCSELKGGG